VTCDWLVDASSRSALLKRKQRLVKPSKHRINAAWFRIDKALSIDDWTDNAEWKQLCTGLSRRPSTNHLMGKGYWAWIIPLAGDRTSIGLVADPEVHALSAYNSFDRFIIWADKNQPQFAERLDSARDSLMDFRCLKNLALNSEKVWSGDRWAMTGESGLFADPFYSPGTDFIALSNTFITDLITGKRSQAELAIRASVYEKMYQSFFDSTMSLYENLYGGFGDTRLMVVKSTWDYAYYWCVLAWLFFREALTDLSFLRIAQSDLLRIRALNNHMQEQFVDRAGNRIVDKGEGRFFDQIEIPVLVQLNAELLHPTGNPEKEFRANCSRLDALAPELLNILAGKYSGNTSILLGDLGQRLI
jgi:hypothetical protein